jgi:hypothetical protein
MLFFMILVGVSPLLQAQPNTLYFMKGIPQTKDVNPARPGILDGYYFSMPLFSKLDLSLNTNNWAYKDLIHLGEGNRADSLVVDLDNFLGHIGKKNFVYESAALTVLEGGFKKGKNFFAVSLTERELAEVFFSKNLVNLIKIGNYPYLGRTYYSGNFGVSVQHYREFAFNYSRDVTKKLTIGGAAKILFGMSAVQTNGINFKASSPANGESLDVVATGRMNISAPVKFTYSPYNEIKSIGLNSNYSIGNYMSNFRNPGMAVDLGFAYHLNKKTELSASVIDLGMIYWSSNVTKLTERGHYLYTGINLNDSRANPPVITQFGAIIDSLGEVLSKSFRPTHSSAGFSTLLPTKIYLGIDYQLRDAISLSGLSRVRIINNTVRTSFSGSANALFWERISLSANYSVMESTFDNFGLGIGIRAGIFQFYAATDNLFSPFYPSKARNMNLRIGINFIFDGKSDEKSGRKGRSGLNPNCQCPY